MVTNKTCCSGQEQGHFISFMVAKKCKPCKIDRRMSDVYREACFSKEKKMFTNELDLRLLPWARVEKLVYCVETLILR